MGETDTSQSILVALSELARIQATAEDRETLYAATAHAAQQMIGHRLFTIMAFDARAMQVQRLYSSNPESYPAGGRKRKRDTEWSHQVLEKGRPFTSSSATDIRTHFDDHKTIFRLGLKSVMNVPIRLGGQTLGTMNLLHQDRHYMVGDIQRGLILAGLLAAPLYEGHE